MYKIRKFFNHIYKTSPKIGFHHVNIHVSRYKYGINSISGVEIYTKKILFIRILDYVTRHKNGTFYNYHYIKNNKLIIHNGYINITIIDDGIRVIHYDELGNNMSDIVITRDNVLIF
jgi:hypothetical protein